MITEDTIERFFKNECTAEEIQAVHKYILSNPELYSKLEEEWNTTNPSQNLPAKISKKLWNAIQNEIRLSRVVPIYIKQITVAASILLLLVSAWLFFKSDNLKSIRNTDGIVSKITTIENLSSLKRVIVLSDSTIVELMPKSSISYLTQFELTKRVVQLNGEAFFAVKKDKIRPFSVKSGAIITTVLGTKFSVKSVSSEQQIKVQLYEGKIAITPSGKQFVGRSNQFELFPGDVFVYSKNTNSPKLIKHISLLESSKIETKPFTNPTFTFNNDNWYMFNNQTLSEVFTQLGQLYQTNISYNPKEFKNMTFIGKIDKSDSLESVLSTISLLNDLQLTRLNEGYIVTKRKKIKK